MKKFLYLAENQTLSYVEGENAEMCYRSICCWFKPRTRIVLVDIETGKANIFYRILDDNGNIACVIDDLAEVNKILYGRVNNNE